MPPRVRRATLLAFCLHGVLILTAQYRLSYDAYNHMFFADHYLKDWWLLWESRWYTGFLIISYPPLTHQLIGLLGHLIGVDAAFALILWVTLSAYPSAVYVFSRIFTGRVPASYAAIGAALLPSLFLTAHTFGQLPTLVGTLFALFGAAVLKDFLCNGKPLTGLLAVFLFTTMMAAHHAVLLFVPFLVGAVLLRLILQQRQRKGSLGIGGEATTANPKEPRKLTLGFRIFIFSIFTGLAGIAVIWPFWNWGRRQTIQTAIDHLSRHNFFGEPFAATLFFLPVYGLLIPFIPFALRQGIRRRFLGLDIAFLFLFLLGLGDTTPLPRWLFGAGWVWLTYDRFAFWASILLLPFCGMAMALILRVQENLWAWRVFAGGMALTGLIIGLIPAWLPTQPQPVNMQPIVDFLSRDDHGEYRYITFGFGDQFAYLSRLTEATTIDGSYHTARMLPELRESGIGQMDTVYWLPGGMSALEPILSEAGEHGVRWGFVNLSFYVPVLERVGWVKLATLSNGVEVWENPMAMLPPPVQPPVENPFVAFSWGFFPLLALFITSALAVRQYWASANSQILSSVQAIAIGLLPLSLTLWYYRKLFVIEHSRIYFTYSDALFFLSDGLALVVVLVWGIRRWPDSEKCQPKTFRQLRDFFTRADGWFVALGLFASLSIFWSLEWRTSLYISLHLWLCLGLYFTLRDMPSALRWFALGCCAALVLQTILGVWEFGAQSTAMMSLLKSEWPGFLVPAMSGASVVQSGDGARWLRVYGTLPHPNVLSGFTLAMMAGPLMFFLSSSKQHLVALFFFLAGLVLLGLTFSRSSWVGLTACAVILLIRWKKFDLNRLVLLGLTSLGTVLILVISLAPLFFTRLGVHDVETEQVSNYTRLWLVGRTLELIHKNSPLGAGMGSFSLALSQYVEEFYQIEPVHNVLLLVMSELGVGGLFLLSGLLIVMVLTVLKTNHPPAIILSGVLMGLLVVCAFDHYFWTLAPGRMMLLAMFGLWSGQVNAYESHR